MAQLWVREYPWALSLLLLVGLTEWRTHVLFTKTIATVEKVFKSTHSRLMKRSLKEAIAIVPPSQGGRRASALVWEESGIAFSSSTLEVLV